MNDGIYQAVNRLIKINREHKRRIDSSVAEIGIHRTGHRILMYLARCGRLPSQKQLSQFFEVTPAAITGAVKRLEADGYIMRKIGSDNRFNELTITDEGRKIVEQTRSRFAKIDEALFFGFSEGEVAEFSAYLERIALNLKEDNEA